MSSTNAVKSPGLRLLRLQEGGLLIVIFILGLLLTFLGGTVKVPVFETNAQGERERVFRTNAQGEREPVVAEKNKFLNAQNLVQLAKDTSFIAIMAIGATFVIISGGIDLSVGSIYALCAVLAGAGLKSLCPRRPGRTVFPCTRTALGVLARAWLARAC